MSLGAQQFQCGLWSTETDDPTKFQVTILRKNGTEIYRSPFIEDGS